MCNYCDAIKKDEKKLTVLISYADSVSPPALEELL